MERLDDWDESAHSRDDHGRFGVGTSEAQEKALSSFGPSLIYPNEPPPNAFHAEERAILARAVDLPERSKSLLDADQKANRKTEAESKEEERTFQAMTGEQLVSVGLFSHGYDFAMRRLDEGMSPKDVTALVDKQWKEVAESGGRPPATNDATPEEHVATAQRGLEGVRSMFHDVAPSPGVVYRGMAVPPNVAEKILNSGKVKLDSMSSFTNEPGVARGFTNMHDNRRDDAIMPGGVQIMMRVSQKSGVNIASASIHRGEREVLLPKGATFKITGATREPPTTDGSYASRLRSRQDGPTIWIDAEEM